MLDGERLGKAIWAALQGIGDKTQTEKFWVELGKQIVLEIVTNGIVNATAMTAPNGPVKGTGKIQ